MKKTIFTAISAAIVGLGVLSSCGEGAVSYGIDNSASELKWKGTFIGDGHAHNGTVKITDGTVDYDGGMFKKGMFSVDLGSMISELKGAEADTLKSHLLGGYFFNMAKANVEVTSITDKEIEGKIMIGEKAVNFVAPAVIRRDGGMMEATSKFPVDFSSAKFMGMVPNPQDTTGKMYVSPKVDFELKLKLKAK